MALKIRVHERLNENNHAYTAHFFNGDKYVASVGFELPGVNYTNADFKKAIQDNYDAHKGEWTTAEIVDNYSLSRKPIAIIKNDGSFKYRSEPKVYKDPFNFIFVYEGDSWFNYPKSVKESVKGYAYGKDVMDAFNRVQDQLKTRLSDTAIEVGHLVEIEFEENYDEDGNRLVNPTRQKYDGSVPSAIKTVKSGFNRSTFDSKRKPQMRIFR